MKWRCFFDFSFESLKAFHINIAI